MIDDMTNHISKEISLLRVNAFPTLDEGVSMTKLQPFPRTLGKFFSKIISDLANKQYQLIESYCHDLLSFTETINYKTRGSGSSRKSERISGLTKQDNWKASKRLCSTRE